MDIDLLWIPGGWNIIIIVFMAKAGSGGYSFFELPTTTLLFLVLLLLVVAVPVLFARPCAKLSKTSMAVSSAAAAARHVLQLSAQQSSSSMEFDSYYKQAAKNKNLTEKHFESSAHEVPSGPNPDSNK
ncbi:hypothetical protein FNV43_RR02326 [Rhamnella rubrinervis]|uniref:Uncharacterized protein n=1 Tax=Rhamnella rubrinervis TaxID=2594499 RepID=A0A8K0HSX1_9ROSA|nr:hypothetical protein FNV43_RR02326 [Rhamnella rubrinervis]